MPVGSELNEGLGRLVVHACEHAAGLGLRKVWEITVDLERAKEDIGRCPIAEKNHWVMIQELKNVS